MKDTDLDKTSLKDTTAAAGKISRKQLADELKAVMKAFPKKP
jgi:hypothetical protein